VTNRDSTPDRAAWAIPVAPTENPAIPFHVTGRDPRTKLARLKAILHRAVRILAGRSDREAPVLTDFQSALVGLYHHDDTIAVVWTWPPKAAGVAAFDRAVERSGFDGVLVHVVADETGGGE
jgi:hypothetical protein